MNAATPTETEILGRYLPMVKQLANNLVRHRPNFMDRDDLIQDGLVGLLKAIRSAKAEFSEDQFRAYAHIRVHGAIIDNIRAHSPISRSEYRDARGKQMAAAGDADTVSKDDLHRADLLVASLFVDGTEFDEEIHCKDMHPGPEDHLAVSQAFWKVFDILGKTPEQQREIFIQCAIYDEQQAQIACRLNISAGRVSQIIKHVRWRLRDAMQ